MIKRYSGQAVAFTVTGTLAAGQTLEAKSGKYNSSDRVDCVVAPFTGGWVITVPSGETLPAALYELTLIVKASGSIIADQSLTYQIVTV